MITGHRAGPGALATVFVFGGCASALQSRSNGELTHHSGSGVNSALFSFIIGFAIQKTIGFRITNEDEIAGVDQVVHGEEGYALADA